MKTTFTVLCLFVAATLPVACDTGSESPGTDQHDSEPTVTTPQPTFVRVRITPVPIDTPTPIPTPVSALEFTTEQLADPAFPDWLDPDVATEQPPDEEIIRGWTEFMSNAVAIFEGGLFTQHFCADGTHLYLNPDIGELVRNSSDWSVTRNPAVSASQWGRVRVNPWLDVSRSGGKFLRQDVEFEIARSTECLEIAAR